MSTSKERRPVDFPTLECIGVDDDFADGIEAIVLEEDTFLVLSADRIARTVDLASTTEAARTAVGAERRLGEVIVRRGTPPKLLAVVHDLAEEPSCSPKAVAQALTAAFEALAQLGAQRVGFQALGSIHGELGESVFVYALKSALDSPASFVRHVCIQLPDVSRCRDVLADLRSR